MNTDVTTPKTFEEKLKDRIKESIGELVSDEDLKKLVDRGVEDTFFTERRNPAYAKASYYDQTNGKVSQTIPSLMNELLDNALRDKIQVLVQAAVDQYMIDNSEMVAEKVKQIVDDGAGEVLMRAISKNFAAPMTNLSMNVESMLMNLRQRGLM